MCKLIKLISEDNAHYIKDYYPSRKDINSAKFEYDNSYINISFNLSLRLRMGKAVLLHPELLDGSRDRE